MLHTIGHSHFFQPVARGGYTAYDAAEGQAEYAYRSLYEPYFLRGKPQSAFADGFNHEQVGNPDEQCFRQTVEKHEKDGSDGLRFTEKRCDGEPDVFQQSTGRYGFSCPVAVGARQVEKSGRRSRQ